MIRRRGAKRLVASAFALAIFGGGCSLIVSGDVPDFQCVGTDPSACPSGMSCDGAKHVCVQRIVDGDAPFVESGDEGSVGESGAEGGNDAADGNGGPADLGQKCRVDNDCKSHMCGSSTTLTTAITSSTGPICTMPCCTSVDCPQSFVCFNGGTGGGYCVPAKLAQRTPPATGGKLGGLACAASSECRSGLCAGTPMKCLDSCCTESDCGGTATCRLPSTLSADTPHVSWYCGAADPGANGAPGTTCIDNTECASDACIGTGTRLCRPPCSNTGSCKTVSGFSAGHCLYGSSGSDYFKFCVPTTMVSLSAAGVACGDNTNCQSGFCDPELQKCANVCARDADCLATEACRPSATNTPYLRCVPKP